jgi:hypothetical protein
MSEPNNFEELKRLLKLKQHEVPPPGYFNHFSGDVVSRIRAGETSGSHGLFARLEGSWLMTVLAAFQAKPGLIGGMATSLCVLLLVGVVLAERTDGNSNGSATASLADAAPVAPVADASPMMASAANLLPAGDSGISMSSNSLHSLQPVPALFGPQQNPLFQNAAFVQNQ